MAYSNAELHTDLALGQYFERVVAAQPDHDFIVYPDRDLSWTYGEFDRRCDQLAKGLLAIGIGKGDHVGIWARNIPDWLTFMFATAKMGAVLVTVNPVYKAHELAYVLKQSDMKALVIIDAFRDVNYVEILRELVPEASTQQRGHLDAAEFPFLKALIYAGPEKHRGFYSVPELLVLGENLPDEPLRAITASLDADDVVNMQYTSGTTGFPKGVMLSSRNIVNNGFYISASARSSRRRTACACRCRSSTASAACWASSRSSRTARPQSWLSRSTRSWCWRPCRRSAPPRSTACRRCSSPSSTTPCSTCSISQVSAPASWPVRRARSRP
jgi:fatty-acyl-CoA synthase